MGFRREAEGEFIAGCSIDEEKDGMIVCKPKMRLPDGTEVPLSVKEVEIIVNGDTYRYHKDGGMTTKNKDLLMKEIISRR